MKHTSITPHERADIELLHTNGYDENNDFNRSDPNVISKQKDPSRILTL
jgi:hypothetical protein